VGEIAGADEIKKAYRNLAFRYHPDRNAGSEEMMKTINEAYAVLSNPDKKNEYDSLRQQYGPSARTSSGNIIPIRTSSEIPI